MKNIIGGLLGCALLVAGITLILLWWPDIVVVFRAALAFGLALGGMLLLYSLNK